MALTGLFVTTWRRRTLIVDVTICDSAGKLVSLAANDVIRLKVGRNSEEPVLELSSESPSANGSSMTTANPTRVVLHEDDLGFTPGHYDLEVGIFDTSDGQLKHAETGVLVQHQTMGGLEDEESSSVSSVSSSTTETSSTPSSASSQSSSSSTSTSSSP